MQIRYNGTNMSNFHSLILIIELDLESLFPILIKIQE